MISVVTPVFRHSNLVEGIIKSIKKSKHKKKEHIVVIDEPSKEMRALEAKYPHVTFVFNNKRLGKSTAVNLAVKKTKGDYLLFIDGDCIVHGDIVQEVYKKSKEYDILSIKYEIIRRNFLSRMVSCEYIVNNMVLWAIAKTTGKCIGVMGAVFAVRKSLFEKVEGFRKVIVEDNDFGTRTWGLGKHGYLDEITVKTEPARDLRDWYKQRKRWGLGGVEYLSKNRKLLLKIAKQNPLVTTIPPLVMYPVLFWLMIIVLFPFNWAQKIVGSLLMFLSVLTPAAIPFVLYYASFSFLRNIVLTAIFFSLYGVVLSIFSLKKRMDFKLFDYVLYFFVYSPMLLIVYVISLFEWSILRRRRVKDWKTT